MGKRATTPTVSELNHQVINSVRERISRLDYFKARKQLIILSFTCTPCREAQSAEDHPQDTSMTSEPDTAAEMSVAETTGSEIMSSTMNSEINHGVTFNLDYSIGTASCTARDNSMNIEPTTTLEVADMSLKFKQTEQHLRKVLGLGEIKPTTANIDMGDGTGSERKREMKIFCVDLTHFSRIVQFVILCAATFFFYLIYGYFQELIFRLEEFRPHGWFLTLVQFACYTCFGLVEMVITGDRTKKIPLTNYFLLAFLTVATMGLSNTAVGYLNYPTQVIFKCCKLIPVMLGGVIIQGKRYTPLDVSAMLMMVVGLIFFTLADNSVSPSFNTYGVVLISLALCADGVIGNFQEKTLKQFMAGNSEMVFYSYSLGFLYILFGILAFGDIFSAIKVSQAHPVETYGYAMIFSLTGYMGLYIVLTLVKSFGALVAVTVTNCRKAVSIILSFLFFTKPFTYQYVWSGLIVVLGIYINVYSKNRSYWDPVISQWGRTIREKLGLQRKYPIRTVTSSVV